MVKVIDAAEAAQLVDDGDTVAMTSFGCSCLNEETLAALEERFLDEGHPRNLQAVHSSGNGSRFARAGLNHLAHDGMVTRYRGGIVSACPDIGKMIDAGKITGHFLPQGVVSQLFREIGSKRPGLITKIGLGTFVDPRLEGGKVNAETSEEYARTIDIDGEEWMFYPSFPIDVALIRGTEADEDGNLTMDHESLKMECLPLAQAAHNTGGIVIAQVERIVRRGTLDPTTVKVPGILIDYLVVSSPQRHMQTESTQFNPAFSGQAKVPVGAIPPIALGNRKVVARRAAMELSDAAVLNLGIGIPVEVGSVANEEGVSARVALTTEGGAIGGVPASHEDFGHSYNVQALMDMHTQFDFYQGGGLDVAVLGLAETSERGDVNVSKFSGKVVGPGGFIDISQSAKTLVFAGTFTAGGLKEEVRDGKLTILTEGRAKKFVKSVEQVSFSGATASAFGQRVLYVTERAVFTLDGDHLTLREIAPGIDLRKDVLDQMEFTPEIAEDLEEMDPGIFSQTWGRLASIMDAKAEAGTEAEAGTKAEAEPQGGAEPEPKAGAKAGAELKAEAEPKAGAK